MTQRNVPSLPLLVLLTACAWACDSETTASTDGEQGGTSSTTTAAGSETTDGNEGSESTFMTEGSESSSTGEGSESSTSGEAVCELPQGDSLGGSTATITIENTTDEPRFVSPYSTLPCNYSQVEVLLDGEPVLWDHEGAYPTSCIECRGGGCSDGGTDGLIINPGQTAEVSWNGGYWEMTALSETCGLEACEGSQNWVEGDSVPSQCHVLRAMEGAAYSVRVNVFDTCPLEEEDCGCDEDVCEVFYYWPKVGDYTVEAGADFPAGATVVLE